MQYVAKQPGWFMSSFSLAWRWLRLLKVTTKRFSQDQPSFTTPWTSSRMELSDGIQQKLRISGTTILFFCFFWEKWWVYQGLPVDRMGSNQRKKWDLTTENIWGVHPPIGDNGDDGVSLPLWRWLGYISQRYPGDLWCERRLLLSSDP